MIKKQTLDILKSPKIKELDLDLPLARFVLRHKNTAVYYSKDRKTGRFLSDYTSLYHNRHEIRLGSRKSIDSIWVLGAEVPKRKLTIKNKHRFDIFESIRSKYLDRKEYWKDIFSGSARWITPGRVWNLSLVSAMIFGMFLMTFIYRYLGQSAAAESSRLKQNAAESSDIFAQSEEKDDHYDGFELDIDKVRKEIEKEKNKSDKEFEEDIRKMVKGYPIEKMIPYIAKKDRRGSLLVSIAKKESDWGKHVPVLKGDDCYNYWGYKGQRKRMGTGGHTCFDSRKDAVDTVAKRLNTLVYKEKVDTPQKMVTVWKCGYDCSWDDPRNVAKWASDVNKYFGQLYRPVDKK